MGIRDYGYCFELSRKSVGRAKREKSADRELNNGRAGVLPKYYGGGLPCVWGVGAPRGFSSRKEVGQVMCFVARRARHVLVMYRDAVTGAEAVAKKRAVRQETKRCLPGGGPENGDVPDCPRHVWILSECPSLSSDGGASPFSKS